MTQMNDLSALCLQDPPHDVDRGVVAVKKGRRRNDPDPIRGFISRCKNPGGCGLCLGGFRRRRVKDFVSTRKVTMEAIAGERFRDGRAGFLLRVDSRYSSVIVEPTDAPKSKSTRPSWTSAISVERTLVIARVGASFTGFVARYRREEKPRAGCLRNLSFVQGSDCKSDLRKLTRSTRAMSLVRAFREDGSECKTGNFA